MRDWIFKWFLSYTKKRGYEVSIVKEAEGTYESYTNYEPDPLDREKELKDVAERIVVHTYIDPQIAQRNSTRKNPAKVTYVNEEQLEKAGGKGAAKLLTRKVNELVNGLNLINHDRYFND